MKLILLCCLSILVIRKLFYFDNSSGFGMKSRRLNISYNLDASIKEKTNFRCSRFEKYYPNQWDSFFEKLFCFRIVRSAFFSITNLRANHIGRYHNILQFVFSLYLQSICQWKNNLNLNPVEFLSHFSPDFIYWLLRMEQFASPLARR